MRLFNENSRVKVAALPHRRGLGCAYLSLNDARWDPGSNMFPGLFEKAVLRVNPRPRGEDVLALLDEVRCTLAGGDPGRAFHQRPTTRTGVRLVDSIISAATGGRS